MQAGVGRGITLLKDYRSLDEIKCVILELTEECSRNIRERKLAARTVTLGVGYSKFDGGGGFSRSKTIDTATNITLDIYGICLTLLHKFYTGRTVRSIHVSLSNFEDDDNVQMSLFSNEDKKRKIGYVMDEIRNKYGSTALLRGTSYMKGAITLSRSNTIGGHFS